MKLSSLLILLSLGAFGQCKEDVIYSIVQDSCTMVVMSESAFAHYYYADRTLSEVKSLGRALNRKIERDRALTDSIEISYKIHIDSLKNNSSILRSMLISCEKESRDIHAQNTLLKKRLIKYKIGIAILALTPLLLI